MNCQSEAKEAKVSAVKPSITSATPLNHNDGDAQYRDEQRFTSVNGKEEEGH